MGLVVVVALRAEIVSMFSGRVGLDEGRRRAGRWDREQLIGGKAIEPCK